MDTGLQIANARQDEIPQISALLLTAYSEYAPEPGTDRSWDEYFVEIGDVQSRWDSSQQIVARDETGRVAGAVTFFPQAWGDIHGLDPFPEGFSALRLLGVDPAARGRGLGRALTEECIARARTLDREWIGLHTTYLMEIAEAMYQRMGFVRFPEKDIVLEPDFTIVAYRKQL